MTTSHNINMASSRKLSFESLSSSESFKNVVDDDDDDQERVLEQKSPLYFHIEL